MDVLIMKKKNKFVVMANKVRVEKEDLPKSVKFQVPSFSSSNLVNTVFYWAQCKNSKDPNTFQFQTNHGILDTDHTDSQFDEALGRRTAANHYERLIAIGCGPFRASDASSLVHRSKFDCEGSPVG